LVADKISAILLFSPEVLVHVSRGVRWDSDHVPVVNDELTALMSEIVRARALDRVHLALDYFDASINRIGAWVTGARATMKALLLALLEPGQRLLEAERAGDGFGRLALLEEAKAMPLGAVWDYHCLKSGVPSGTGWVDAIKEYEKAVLSGRKG
jgi:L-rhamnose isomerase